MEGGESTTLFGNCPTLSPSISASPIASEMPSNAPIISVAPSSRPSERRCSATQEKFQMFITPDSTDPSDVYFQVKLYKNGSYSRIIHSFDKYSNNSANQRNVRCLRYNSCFKVIVRSKAGTGIGTGSFSAYWKGTVLQCDTFPLLILEKLLGNHFFLLHNKTRPSLTMMILSCISSIKVPKLIFLMQASQVGHHQNLNILEG